MNDPSTLHIATRSGSVRITGEPGAALSIEGGRVEVTAEGITHVIGASPSQPIIVKCSDQTNIVVGTVSGSVDFAGVLGAVSVNTISGTIHVERARRVDARTKSGRVEIERCDEQCRIVTVSSRVKIEHAAKAMIAAVSGRVAARNVERADVKTVSGTVELETTGPPHVVVRTVSGTVDVRVPRDTRPATKLRSMSGTISCDCPTGDNGEIAVASVSGTIRVSCR
ncbi:MAG TPA: DUF4097 family beta strand repeat-containing protein [Acidimicrobiia bacterium]|nr:DUF4097 family beta strand repeat-containing protein [Acidimicrobiia bacterium]